MKVLHYFLCIGFLFIIGCGMPYHAVKGSATIPVINAGSTIVVAWAPFSDLDLSVYNITDTEKAKNTEAYLNKAVFQKRLKKSLKGYSLLFATSPHSGFPQEGDILITVQPQRIKKKWDLREGDSDLLYTDIEVISISDKKKLYSGSLTATSLGAYHNDYMSRLKTEVKNLSRCIADLLNGKLQAAENIEKG